MWKVFFAAAILLITTSFVYANSDENYYTADNSEIITTSSPVINTSYPKITQIEKRLYSKSYENEDIYQRLKRLELTLHKTTSDNIDLATRVDNLSDQLQISAMPGYLLNDISDLESSNFDKVFKKDTPDSRLERLEYHLIGALQEGNYKDRIYKLKTLTDQHNVTQYFDSNSTVYDSDSYTAPVKIKKTKWTSVQNAFLFLAPFFLGLL